MNTYHAPETGSRPSRVRTSAERPSKDIRMSAGAVASQMPPAGRPAITPASGGERPRRRDQARPQWPPAERNPEPPQTPAPPVRKRLRRKPPAAAPRLQRLAAGLKLTHQLAPVLGAAPHRRRRARRLISVHVRFSLLNARLTRASGESGNQSRGSTETANALVWPVTALRRLPGQRVLSPQAARSCRVPA